MNFAFALTLLKAGRRVHRTGWNGKDMFIYLVPGSELGSGLARPPLSEFVTDDQKTINYRPHIDMKTVDGEFVPWVASQTDLLADDWETYSQESDETIRIEVDFIDEDPFVDFSGEAASTLKDYNFESEESPNWKLVDIDPRGPEDLSGELQRVYTYPDGTVIRIDDPMRLYVTSTGSHCVMNINDWVTHVPAGWIDLKWKPRDPENPVAF